MVVAEEVAVAVAVVLRSAVAEGAARAAAARVRRSAAVAALKAEVALAHHSLRHRGSGAATLEAVDRIAANMGIDITETNSLPDHFSDSMAATTTIRTTTIAIR